MRSVLHSDIYYSHLLSICLFDPSNSTFVKLYVFCEDVSLNSRCLIKLNLDDEETPFGFLGTFQSGCGVAFLQRFLL